MIISTGNILLVGSIILFVSILAGKVSNRFGTPTLLIFLVVGMLFGTDGLGIEFNSFATAQFVGMMAMSIILFSGGMDTNFKEIRPVLGEGIVLATLGVALTAALTGLFIYWLGNLWGLTLSLPMAFLLASVMSSTDSASVFAILRSKKQGLSQNLRPLLELESGSNDPMAYILTIMLIQVVVGGGDNIWQVLFLFAQQMGIGAIAGFLLGKLAVRIINKISIGNKSLYSVLLLSLVFFIFAFTDLIKGNGYLAVYIAGLVVGNNAIAHKRTLATFLDGITWLFQIVMFLTLGLLVNPHELLDVVWVGLAVGVFMILVSRPAAVFLSLIPFRKLTTNAKSYVAWVGLRGAAPILFATYPKLAGIDPNNTIFNIVFFITIISLLTQGTTVGSMAKVFHVSVDAQEKGFDIDLPDEVKAALTEMEITDTPHSGGDTIKDITLPEKSLVVMIRRGNNYIVPNGGTMIKKGDKLLLISEDVQQKTENIIERRGRIALRKDKRIK